MSLLEVPGAPPLRRLFSDSAYDQIVAGLLEAQRAQGEVSASQKPKPNREKQARHRVLVKHLRARGKLPGRERVMAPAL